VARAVQGNEEALGFLRGIAQVMHTWDDLVDRDHDLTDDDINRAFWIALVELPNNPFYAAHRATLQAIIVNSIINWGIATNIERNKASTSADQRIAFIIRSSYIDLAVMCATLVGGSEWGITCGYGLRAWAHSEGFDGYLKALSEEAAAREKR
jgi:hypothetical protein